jgi:hypothetical protein
MINYHLYRNYFPLWALGRYERMLEQRHSTTERALSKRQETSGR